MAVFLLVSLSTHLLQGTCQKRTHTHLYIYIHICIYVYIYVYMYINTHSRPNTNGPFGNRFLVALISFFLPPLAAREAAADAGPSLGAPPPPAPAACPSHLAGVKRSERRGQKTATQADRPQFKSGFNLKMARPRCSPLDHLSSSYK